MIKQIFFKCNLTLKQKFILVLTAVFVFLLVFGFITKVNNVMFFSEDRIKQYIKKVANGSNQIEEINVEKYIDYKNTRVLLISYYDINDKRDDYYSKKTGIVTLRRTMLFDSIYVPQYFFTAGTGFGHFLFSTNATNENTNVVVVYGYNDNHKIKKLTVGINSVYYKTMDLTNDSIFLEIIDGIPSISQDDISIQYLDNNGFDINIK